MTTITARHGSKSYTAVYASPAWQVPQAEPWTPAQLHRAMIATGWRPLPEAGQYIHSGTFMEIDINEKDSQGDPVWLSWAVAQMTPPPF